MRLVLPQYQSIFHVLFFGNKSVATRIYAWIWEFLLSSEYKLEIYIFATFVCSIIRFPAAMETCIFAATVTHHE
jgi:hypothetical protein